MVIRRYILLSLGFFSIPNLFGASIDCVETRESRAEWMGIVDESVNKLSQLSYDNSMLLDAVLSEIQVVFAEVVRFDDQIVKESLSYFFHFSCERIEGYIRVRGFIDGQQAAACQKFIEDLEKIIKVFSSCLTEFGYACDKEELNSGISSLYQAWKGFGDAVSSGFQSQEPFNRLPSLFERLDAFCSQNFFKRAVLFSSFSSFVDSLKGEEDVRTGVFQALQLLKNERSGGYRNFFTHYQAVLNYLERLVSLKEKFSGDCMHTAGLKGVFIESFRFFCIYFQSVVEHCLSKKDCSSPCDGTLLRILSDFDRIKKIFDQTVHSELLQCSGFQKASKDFFKAAHNLIASSSREVKDSKLDELVGQVLLKIGAGINGEWSKVDDMSDQDYSSALCQFHLQVQFSEEKNADEGVLGNAKKKQRIDCVSSTTASNLLSTSSQQKISDDLQCAVESSFDDETFSVHEMLANQAKLVSPHKSFQVMIGDELRENDLCVVEAPAASLEELHQQILIVSVSRDRYCYYRLLHFLRDALRFVGDEGKNLKALENVFSDGFLFLSHHHPKIFFTDNDGLVAFCDMLEHFEQLKPVLNALKDNKYGALFQIKQNTKIFFNNYKETCSHFLSLKNSASIFEDYLSQLSEMETAFKDYWADPSPDNELFSAHQIVGGQAFLGIPRSCRPDKVSVKPKKTARENCQLVSDHSALVKAMMSSLDFDNIGKIFDSFDKLLSELDPAVVRDQPFLSSAMEIVIIDGFHCFTTYFSRLRKDVSEDAWNSDFITGKIAHFNKIIDIFLKTLGCNFFDSGRLFEVIEAFFESYTKFIFKSYSFDHQPANLVEIMEAHFPELEMARDQLDKMIADNRELMF